MHVRRDGLTYSIETYLSNLLWPQLNRGVPLCSHHSALCCSRYTGSLDSLSHQADKYQVHNEKNQPESFGMVAYLVS